MTNKLTLLFLKYQFISIKFKQNALYSYTPNLQFLQKLTYWIPWVRRWKSVRHPVATQEAHNPEAFILRSYLLNIHRHFGRSFSLKCGILWAYFYSGIQVDWSALGIGCHPLSYLSTRVSNLAHLWQESRPKRLIDKVWCLYRQPGETLFI